MEVTYLYHSGYVLEWENCVWIFDYYKGELPVLERDKKIFVFSSHWHQDHFNPEICKKLEGCVNVTYIFSYDIKKKIKRYHLPEKVLSAVAYMKPDEERRFSWEGEEMQVRTLRSTDCGVAFTATYRGQVVYHAGDLNCWMWEEDERKIQEQMEKDYIKELKKLRGIHILAAFVPLDPRLAVHYAKGMDYYREIAGADYLFPMHMWEDYSIAEQYTEHIKAGGGSNDDFQQVKAEGQKWVISIENKM